MSVPSYSVQFNGSTQYLKLPSNASAWTLAGNFTLECWINVPNTNQLGIFTMNWNGDWNAAGNGFSLNNNVIVTPSGNITWTSPSINTWHHLAAVRSGTTITVYLDGTSVGSGTNSSQFGNASCTPGIGLFDTNPGVRAAFSGSISNLRLVKGTALYTTNFTPPNSPLTAISGTSLLACNASTIIDGSSNNFTITAVASPTVTTNTPFFTTGIALRNTVVQTNSVQFDGSSYLSLTGQNITGANFTIECWVYFNTFTTYTAPHIFNFGTNTDNRFGLWRNGTSGKFNLAVINGAVYTLLDAVTVPTTGRWYHVALVKNGGTTYLYINGTQELTTGLGLNGGTNWSIGFMQFGVLAGDHLNGYISNFRVVAGTAVYTSNFTAPTAPLTAISNTALLTANASTIRDASTNNYTITSNGSPTVSISTPFGISYPSGLKLRNTAIQSYSVALNGSSQYLDSTRTGGWLKPGSNWTIECWAYFTRHPSSYNGAYNSEIASSVNSGGTAGFEFRFESTTSGASTTGVGFSAIISFGSGVGFTATKAFSTNTWYHIAVVRSGTTVTIYADGVSIGSSTISTWTENTTLNIGKNAYSTYNYYFPGYISNFRIVDGTAVYTGNFTTPALPLTAVANTALLTCNDSTIKDGSSNNYTINSTGSPSVSSSLTPFGPNYSTRLKIYSVT